MLRIALKHEKEKGSDSVVKQAREFCAGNRSRYLN